MARRAKLLNQFAHLQLLQRCAASCRRGRASIGVIADTLRKSEAPALPTTVAVLVGATQCTLPALDICLCGVELRMFSSVGAHFRPFAVCTAVYQFFWLVAFAIESRVHSGSSVTRFHLLAGTDAFFDSARPWLGRCPVSTSRAAPAVMCTITGPCPCT